MAIQQKQIHRKVLKLLKKPSLLGLCILLVGIAYNICSQELHAQKLISSEIRVIDGDTIKLHGQSIRLQGIDAPELKQQCSKNINGKLQQYPCDEDAAKKLTQIIGDSEVKCTDEGMDKYNRQLSYCYVGDVNINRKMVADGYAVASSYYDITFVFDEYLAKVKSAGLWAGEFENPREWRKKRKMQ